MKNTLYINSDVSKILNITPREILAWSDKGLVVPYQQSSGAGTKRLYNYVNLFEFLLCDLLLDRKKVNIQHVKNLLCELRRTKQLELWVLDFDGFYKNVLNKEKGKSKKIDIPKENIGTLVIHYSSAYDDVSLIPLSKVDAVNFIEEREREKGIESIDMELIDLGILKKFIDMRLQKS